MKKIAGYAMTAFMTVCMVFPSMAGQLQQENLVWNGPQEDEAALGGQNLQDEDGKRGPFEDYDQPVTPSVYQELLGRGMDVDWSKTSDGRNFYTAQTVDDFLEAGISHVRIRVKDDLDLTVLAGLDRQINDCLQKGLIPVLAYQADAFKNNPCQDTIGSVVNWWSTAAKHYRDKSHMLAFDLMIESSDELNKQPDALNQMIEQAVAAIRQTNPDRMIMMSPRLRSDPTYLSELKVPANGNGYLMAEWHFYASGPSKINERKLWTSGTEAEKQLIMDKINLAAAWQQQTGIPTWVGAWMPGNYNDGDDYSLNEQMEFAEFMCDSLEHAKIPFSVNSDTKFYDRENQTWLEEMIPLRDLIFQFRNF